MKIDDAIKRMHDFSLDEAYVRKLYKEEGVSLADLAEAINQTVGERIINGKEGATKLLNTMGIPKRTREESERIRTNRLREMSGDEHPSAQAARHADDVIRMYQNGASLAAIYRDLGISPPTSKKILARAGIELAPMQLSPETLYNTLQGLKVDKEAIAHLYIGENMSQKDLSKKLTEITGREVGLKATGSLLQHLGIKKNEAQIKKSQGIRGRKMRDESMEKLARAGWESLDALALYYVENPSLSYGKLAEELNGKIGEEFFTTRWVEKNIAPIVKELDPPAMSRLEAGVKELAEEILGEKLISGDRKVLNGAELDLYSPSRGIAIEVNGDYWHSDRFMVANKGITAAEYHRSKWLDCKAKGIELIFVWESDWINNHRLTKELITKFLTTGEVDLFLTQVSKPLFVLDTE